jgi:hypothetical protein
LKRDRPARSVIRLPGPSIDNVACVRKRAQQVLQLSRGDRGCLRLLSRELGVRGDLHFEVRRGDEELPVTVLDQHIRKDGQRVPPFDDARYRLEWSQHASRGVVLVALSNPNNS